ncbi:anthranilate synthase component II [Companilactobacillus sp.]|jgi:anthranilate synthase/aminodeoxychorismate synthase-like glutamine amidotransferase|uniref:anthranilate synthase component II n=1 Tax=Companilactobacillus sp. TaxID=2767905 RepID=UPI0025C52E48|nr:aminodeoxychorismate/anthranilate synthase component II [Companilactobacillus sp.]MCH4009031.1 aminodeoxychorismate/anthranilate synthase component II [Companilactobacillus sp.]MCH4050790.1 aminodeoxychorismate/anthranilate synthase component II [Companilactobacillus sp.]MCH4076973.1 aminodeoxychorismate/anthranilate synthase component II [Companilactobacillus sp.]MCH4125549.1 aminodeoxychorismate/anthranilate synthase component II [Companilactobacillus sp.]MCI1311258.1 aminodeoxychorismate
MIYLIDNYDSFTYNLYQLIGTNSNEPITVVKNDELTVEELESLHPTGLVFSPGPGRPEDAGNMMELLKHFIGKVPILGVCLGEQAIGEVYGAKVVHAPVLMHGRPSEVEVTDKTQLFSDCPKTFEAARYHSLIVDPQTIPDELSITAITKDGEIMALCDEKQKVFGVQFHPESIMTEPSVGKQIIENYLALI